LNFEVRTIGGIAIDGRQLLQKGKMATNCKQSWENILGLLQTIGNVAKGSTSVAKVGW
jgi:hypothetical protein